MAQNKKILNDLTPVYDFRKGYDCLTIPAAAGDVAMEVTNIAPLGALNGTFYQSEAGNRTFTINGITMPINPAGGSATWWGLLYDGSNYFTISNFSTGSSQEQTTTPAAPTVVADDTANTLDFTHALGDTEILISENNGAYTQYNGGPISVGDVARGEGYWKAKIKSATGRNESPVALSPAFTGTSIVYDADAQAYFNKVQTAGVTLTGGQQTAINDFVATLKSAGIYTKLYDFGLFAGGTAATNALGFKNAINLTFNGGWTHSATGSKPNGTTGWAETGFNIQTQIDISSISFSVYSREDIDGGGDIGFVTGAGDRFLLQRIGGNAILGLSDPVISVANTSGIGWYVGTRDAAGLATLYKNGTSLGSATTTLGTNPGTLSLGRLNGINTEYSQREISFWHIGTVLTAGEVATMNTALQTLNIALGRSTP